MTPRQAALVQASHARFLAQDHAAAQIFYDHLFRIAPDTRALFPDDMTLQYHKFMELLGTLVNSLHKFDTLAQAVRELGLRHAGYGVRDEHFGAMGEALIAMLGEVFGPAFTPELKFAWTAAYWRVALTMQDAMDAAAAEEHRSATA